jgi:hypothetical protein
MLTNMAVLSLFCSVPFTAPVSLAAAEEREVSIESPPAGSNGVAVVIRASKYLFGIKEPLNLQIVFRNTTDQVIWLPPASWNYWALHLNDTSTGKSFTGVTTFPMGVSLPPPPPPPLSLQAHESKTWEITFQRFGFVQGDVSFAAAKDRIFGMTVGTGSLPDPGQFPLPPGVYNLTLEVRSPNGYRQALAKEENEHGVSNLPKDFDSASFWKEDILRSGPIEIKIAGAKL